MSGALKARFNPRLSAARREVYTGTAKPGEFPRLRETLAGEGGALEYRVESLDQGKRVRVQAQGTLELACELSLEHYQQPVAVDTLLEVVASEDEAALLPEAAEAVVTHKEQLVLRELIEDELLLALPISPRKPGVEVADYLQEDPAGDTGKGEAETPANNAFAVLKDLNKPKG